MIWVGVTGSMGSGKSSVCKVFREMGHPVVSADEVSRQTSSKGSDALVEIEKSFGSQVVGRDGELDRPVLSRLVFGNPEALRKLEAILHPRIQQYVKSWRSEQQDQGHDLAFYDIPLLFENHLKSQFDKVITVTADEDIIVDRVAKRSGLSEEEIRRRLRHQVPVSEKIKQSDYVIENNGSMEDLRLSSQSVLDQILHQPQE